MNSPNKKVLIEAALFVMCILALMSLGLAVTDRTCPALAQETGCVGGCYGSASNCQRNYGQPCVKVDAHVYCGWPVGYTAYRCCRGIAMPIAAKTSTPAKAPTPTITSGAALYNGRDLSVYGRFWASYWSQ